MTELRFAELLAFVTKRSRDCIYPRTNKILRLREAEIAYIQEQIKSSKGDSNCIWKTIRQCLPSGDSNRPTYTRDATVVVEEFNDFFTTVGMKSAQLAKDIAHKFELPCTRY
jgi:hypothetical protein